MSYIKLPDPYPGRCQNYRTHQHSDGHIETLRCIDYENTPHQCIFPEPKYVVSTDHNIFTSNNNPEPWVKPKDEGKDESLLHIEE